MSAVRTAKRVQGDEELVQVLGGKLLEASQHLTAREVARLLRVSVRTVWRWVRQGRLPLPVRFTRNSPRWPYRLLAKSLRLPPDR